MAMMSILNLYNYDSNIFSGLALPDGMDKDNTIDNILLECAELSLVYTDPVFMRKAIKQWSDKEQKIWGKLWATENLVYNPIWNVDGTVTETETFERNKNNNIDRATSSGETTSDDVDQTTIDSVTGYNSTAWQDHTKSVVDSDRDIRRNISGTDNVDEEESEDSERSLETRRTGNIGVTTTQSMIREEREVAQFNTIDYITQSFKKRFCVMVY